MCSVFVSRTYGYHTSLFFRTCPHFQGINYRPGGIYKIKENVSSWIARVFCYHLTSFLPIVLFKNVCFVILSNQLNLILNQ
jgi:hypothetical protein